MSVDSPATTRPKQSFGEVTPVSLDDLDALWRSHRSALLWSCPFALPPWLKAWWNTLGQATEPLIAVVRQGEVLLGAAPLMVQGRTLRFLGDPSVCDYFDCVVAQGKEQAFFQTLLAYLSSHGFKKLDLGPLRPDAVTRESLVRRDLSCSVEWRTEPEDVFSELNLPGTWDEFLESLDGKQRHELRRKLRRLNEAGAVRFRRADGPAQLPEAVETFLSLFGMNRKDKAAFMTGAMLSFFQVLSRSLAEEGLLRLFFLELDEQPVASVFCFDHGGTRYLYNNGYDGGYEKLSVGLLSKVLSLQAAIHDGLRTYNFLKGAELYKTRLGGKQLPMSRCHVEFNGG